VKVSRRPAAVIASGLSVIALAAGTAVAAWQAGTVRPRASSRATASVLPAHAQAAPDAVPVQVFTRTVGAPGAVFTGDRVEVSAFGIEPGGNATQQWPVQQVRLDFGDGTSQLAEGRCGTRAAPLAAHTYQSSGLFHITVAAARLCDPQARADLSESGQDVVVLRSAPAAAWSWPRCGQDQVQISASVRHVQLVSWAMSFTVRNVSASDCHLYGYPGLRFVCPDGSLLRPGAVLRSPGAGGSGLPPHLVALAPGDVASFAVGYAEADYAPSGACRGPVDETEVFLPGSATYSLIHITGDTEAAGIGLTWDFTTTTVVPGATPWT
jgi:Protein of unknown function (DUF4232)